MSEITNRPFTPFAALSGAVWYAIHPPAGRSEIGTGVLSDGVLRRVAVCQDRRRLKRIARREKLGLPARAG